MKKSISYLWPLTKKFSTNYNKTLEVTWLNGKKVLDSNNANYSYGALEKVLDFGLSYARADRSSEILVLGLGGGSVLGLLRKKFNYYGRLTAVEIDPVIIKIAVEEFGIKKFEPLNIICEDAFKFVANPSGPYGLIIVDIFIDTHVPVQFYSLKFWKNIAQLLKKEGTVIFNAGIHSTNEKEINLLTEEIKTLLNFKKFEKVHGINTLLLGTKPE